jgi:hypothetical protein
VQGCGGQARGVAVHAEYDDPVVIPGHPGQPGVATGIQAPLQVVALHDDRAGYLALFGPLGGGPDVDEHRAAGPFPEGLVRRQPDQPPARGGEDLVDAPRAGRPARHHAAGPSVPIFTSPPAVSSYRVISGMGGEYACTLTASEEAAVLRTSWI